MTREDAVYVLN